VYYNPGFQVDMWTQLQTTATVSPEIWWIQTGVFKKNYNDSSKLLIPAMYTQRNCSFAPAIVEYAVGFHDGNLQLPTDMSIGRILDIANNTQQYMTANKSKQPQTLVLLGTLLGAYVSSNVSFSFALPAYPNETWGVSMGELNSFSLRYFNASSEYFDDPMSDIVSTFNHILVRGSAIWSNHRSLPIDDKVDPGVSANQTISGQATSSQNFFVSDFRFFVAAAVLGESIV
jgi:hypothetical protein